MNKQTLLLIWNILLLIAVVVLFYLYVHQHSSIQAKHSSPEVPSPSVKLAYVDLDTLQAYYTYFKEKRQQLEMQQSRMEKELQADAQRLQKEYAEFQQKASTMTQAEGEAAQQKLLQHQQQFQSKQENMRQQLMAQQQAFQDSLQQELHDFLKTYNANKHYQFIFSYSSGLSDILYKDTALDITRDVIDGLNALHPSR
ncbi:MAG: OmpH family outer membrane protein [Thermoflavifilum sp.]|nr:OmpH family outer membrane protein [Thermoflavifilum sp.]